MKTFKSNKQVNKLMNALIIIFMIGVIVPIAASSESEFLPGVEGISNITWGYPEGYYKDGYPVEGNK